MSMTPLSPQKQQEPGDAAGNCVLVDSPTQTQSLVVGSQLGVGQYPEGWGMVGSKEMSTPHTLEFLCT